MPSVIVMAALVALLVASLALMRNIRLLDYASYRGKASTHYITMSLLSSLVGGWMFFGLSAIGFEAGVVGLVMGVGYAGGLLLFAREVPRIKKILEKTDADTMDEFLGNIYGDIVQGATSIINLSFFLAVLAAQFVALGSFLDLFLPYDRKSIFVAASLVVLVYTVLTGFKGVLFTDSWQLWLIGTAILAMLAANAATIDPGQLSTLDPEMFTGLGYGAIFLIGIVLFLPISLIVRTDLWQRVASGKGVREVQRSLYIASPLLLLFYAALTSLGMIARASSVEVSDPATSTLVHFLDAVQGGAGSETTLLLELTLGVFAVGILAALLSTIDTNLSVVSVAFSKMLRKTSWQRFESARRSGRQEEMREQERHLLAATRMVAAVLGGVGLGLALLVPDIVDLIVAAASIILVFLPATVAGLRMTNPSPMAAGYSIVGGYAVFLAALLVTKDPKVAFVPGVLFSGVVFMGIQGMVTRRIKRSSRTED